MIIHLDSNFFYGFLFFLLTFEVICGKIVWYYVYRMRLDWMAKELSTHKIEYVPLDLKLSAPDEKMDELNDSLEEDPDLMFLDPKTRRDLL